MADAKMLNREKVLAKLRRIPQRVQTAVGSQLAKEVEDLTEAIQRAAPVGTDEEKTPGELRDSVHFYPTPDRPLSYRVLADAKDAKGDFIGSHVEAGHRAEDGTHVAARPFFFPTYRARKKPMRRRLTSAASKAAKTAFEAD
jgi:hypothetical protein